MLPAPLCVFCSLDLENDRTVRDLRDFPTPSFLGEETESKVAKIVEEYRGLGGNN